MKHRALELGLGTLGWAVWGGRVREGRVRDIFSLSLSLSSIYLKEHYGAMESQWQFHTPHPMFTPLCSSPWHAKNAQMPRCPDSAKFDPDGLRW